MSALSAARTNFANKTPLVNKIGRPADTAKTFYNGAMVALASASRWLKPNDGTAGDKIVGCVDLKQHPSVLTAGSAGASKLDVITGIFPFAIGTSGDALAQADVGNIVYGIDDQTVGKTDGGTGRPVAGELIELETIGGVAMAWVYIAPPTTSARSNGSVEAVSAAGPISVATDVTTLAVTGTTAYTLANGLYAGQRKIVTVISGASTPVGTITPATPSGFATVTALGAPGDSVEFIWTGSAWVLGPSFGVTFT